MDNRTCSISGCGRAAETRGWCKRHYQNWRTTGDPVGRWDKPLDVRLRMVGWTITPAGCWEWNGKRNVGNYGAFSAKRLGYVDAPAHRVVYEWLVEPIPEGLLLRHKCDNPPCVNPDHLIPGTDADNTRDSIERGRFYAQRMTYCRSGLHDLTLPGARIARGCRECRRAASRRYEARKRQKRMAGRNGALLRRRAGDALRRRNASRAPVAAIGER